jgi:hypothetical protein
MVIVNDCGYSAPFRCHHAKSCCGGGTVPSSGHFQTDAALCHETTIASVNGQQMNGSAARGRVTCPVGDSI